MKEKINTVNLSLERYDELIERENKYKNFVNGKYIVTRRLFFDHVHGLNKDELVEKLNDRIEEQIDRIAELKAELSKPKKTLKQKIIDYFCNCNK